MTTTKTVVIDGQTVTVTEYPCKNRIHGQKMKVAKSGSKRLGHGKPARGAKQVNKVRG